MKLQMIQRNPNKEILQINFCFIHKTLKAEIYNDYITSCIIHVIYFEILLHLIKIFASKERIKYFDYSLSIYIHLIWCVCMYVWCTCTHVAPTEQPQVACFGALCTSFQKGCLTVLCSWSSQIKLDWLSMKLQGTPLSSSPEMNLQIQKFYVVSRKQIQTLRLEHIALGFPLF